ncbi:MAG: metallophosphoesterase [Granulosicoccus sp.]
MFIASQPFSLHAAKCSLILLLVIGLLVSLTSRAQAEDIKVAFIGDQGIDENARSVLELIRDEGTDLLLIQGDLGYDDNAADTWIENIDGILGRDFPVLMVVGNHENFEWPTYLEWQKDKLSRVRDIRCEGDISVKAYCTYKNIGIVQVAPIITEVEGIDGFDDYAGYITEKLSDDNSTWRICSWHKNMRDMQAGGKTDATGWGVYQNCLAQGGLVMTGHEHSYSRTHLMSDFENTTVIHTDDNMDIGPGSSLVVVSGLGGREVRDQQHDGDWFASIYTATQNASAGSLFCTFEGDQADCYFKDIAGLVPDTFKLRSKLVPDNNDSDDSDSGENTDEEDDSDGQEPGESEEDDSDNEGAEDQTPDESDDSESDADNSDDQTSDESDNDESDTDNSDDQTPDESDNDESDADNSDDQTPDASDDNESDANNSDDQTPDESDNDESDSEGSDMQTGGELEDSDSQGTEEENQMPADSQDGATETGENLVEPVADESDSSDQPDTSSESDDASGESEQVQEEPDPMPEPDGGSDELAQQSEITVVFTNEPDVSPILPVEPAVENPFVVTTPFADIETDDSATVQNISPPPPQGKAPSTGAGASGWLFLLASGLATLLRRRQRMQ